jgi:hypothetical protein
MRMREIYHWITRAPAFYTLSIRSLINWVNTSAPQTSESRGSNRPPLLPVTVNPFLKLRRKQLNPCSLLHLSVCQTNHSYTSIFFFFTSSSAFSSVTLQVGWSGNVSELYLGEVRFEFRPGPRLSWLRYSWLFSVPPGKLWDSTLNYTRSHASQFIIHYRPEARTTNSAVK